MINIGIIGYGKVGKTRHKILSKIKNVKIVSICDTYFIEHKNKSIIYSPDANKVIENNDIDTVFISVPNFLNKKYTIKSLLKNKNVFCEKPPALNSREMNEIIKYEKKSKGKLMYGFNHRLHKSVRYMKNIVDSKKFGQILWMRGRYGKSVDKNFFNNWRSKKKYSGGGIFLDQGIHMLDLFLHFAGNFDVVKASVSNLYWKTDVEDNAFIIVENTKSKISASLHSTMTQWRHLFSLEIFLERGYLVLNGLKTSSNSYGKEILTIAKNRSLPPASSWTKEINKEYNVDNSFEVETKIFIDSVVKNKPISSSNSKDALKLMKIVDQIYKNQKK